MIKITEYGIVSFLLKTCSRGNCSLLQCTYRTWKRNIGPKKKSVQWSGKIANGYRKLEEKKVNGNMKIIERSDRAFSPVGFE